MDRRVIPAIDVSELWEAELLAAKLGSEAYCLKVGLELLHAEGTPRVLSALQAKGAQVFADVKIDDIPNTAARASRVITRLGARMFNVHCTGGSEMMRVSAEAAAEEADKNSMPRPLVLGVTLLTSLDFQRLISMGLAPNYAGFRVPEDEEREEIYAREMERIVVTLAFLAMEAGLDGVVASPGEAQAIRCNCGPEFKIVTPGIRPAGSAKNDQARIATPAAAIEAGADFLVIGRPITEAPDQALALRQINEAIKAVAA